MFASYHRYAISALLLLTLFMSCVGKRKVEVVNVSDASDLPSRESITFILGDDANSNNKYYHEAAEYYRVDNNDRTEYLVSSCRSLTEISSYLINNPPSNGQPWGMINLVTHGNQWLGLSVRVIPGKFRTSAKSIQAAINQGVFSPLPEAVIDSKSEITVHGCGIGNNKSLINAMGNVFSSKTEKPLVRASLFFENYISTEDADYISDTRRYLTAAYFAYYKKGYRPGDIRLSRQLTQRYPDQKINWRDILTRKEPRWAGDSFHYTFNVPVKWIVLYENEYSIPDISNNENQQQWLLEQEELLAIIESTEIPMNKFSWNIKTIKYKCEDGTLVPAVRAKGLATILCVLKPLLSDNQTQFADYQPMIPSLYDTAYYYIDKGSTSIP